MRIIVVSDTHGDTQFRQVLDAYQADAIFHAGDSELDYDAKAMQGMYRIRGNNDRDVRYETELSVTLGGKTIFITHGHLYDIYNGLQRLDYRAQEVDADIVLFGHTHLLGAEQVGETLYLNPGSFTRPRGGNPATFAILDVRIDGSVKVTYRTPKGVIVHEVIFK